MVKKNIRILRENQGATAVEFAIVAPVLLLLLTGIVELGLILFASSVMENTANMAARYGITGDDYSQAGDFQRNTKGLSREEFIRDTISTLSMGIMDPKRVEINNRVFPNFAGATSNTTSSGENFGGSGQSVLYFMTYKWGVFTPMVGQFFTEGTYRITSSALVANERY